MLGLIKVAYDEELFATVQQRMPATSPTQLGRIDHDQSLATA